MNAEQLARDIQSLPSAHKALDNEGCSLLGGSSIADKVAELVRRLNTARETLRETHKALDTAIGSDTGKNLRLPDRIAAYLPSSPADRKWTVSPSYSAIGKFFRVTRMHANGSIEVANTMPISERIARLMAEELNRG